MQGVHEGIFRTVDIVPNPPGAVVQPDPMMAALAPRAFRKTDRRTGRMRREKVRGRDHVDLSFEFSENRLEPPRAFEPPMAKELGVERRDDDAGSARRLPMFPKGFDDQGCEVVRMGVGSLLRGLRIVGDLLPQGKAPVRDAPISEAVHSVFAMEFQVGPVPRISVIRTPDLDAGPRVPSKDRDLPPPP